MRQLFSSKECQRHGEFGGEVCQSAPMFAQPLRASVCKTGAACRGQRATSIEGSFWMTLRALTVADWQNNLDSQAHLRNVCCLSLAWS